MRRAISFVTATAVALFSEQSMAAAVFPPGLSATDPKVASIIYANDPKYGACIWDASHDVGACINNAIAAATSGAIVYMPLGQFGQSTMVELPNDGRAIRFYGQGKGITRLCPLPGTSLEAQVHQTAPASAVWYQAGPHEIAHMTLCGNSLPVHNVEMVDAHRVRIHDAELDDPLPGATGTSNVKFMTDGIAGHLAWENSIGDNVSLRAGPNPNPVTDLSRSAAYCIEAAGSDSNYGGAEATCSYAQTEGVHVTGGNNRIRSMHIYNTPVCASDDFVSPLDIDGAVCDTPTSAAWKVQASNSKIQNTHAFWYGMTPGSSVYGVEITQPITGSSIVGNVIETLPAAQKIFADLGRVGTGNVIRNNPGAAVYTGAGTDNGNQGGFAPFRDGISDSTTTNGNALGQGAAEMNYDRSQNTQVASGNGSMTQGYGNTASGFGALAMGSLNISDGAYAFVRGQYGSAKQGNGRNVSASGRFAVTGDAQWNYELLMAASSAAGDMELTVGGLTPSFFAEIPVAASQAYKVRAEFIARRADGAIVTFDMDLSQKCMVVRAGAPNALTLGTGSTCAFVAGATAGTPPSVSAPTLVLNANGSFTVHWTNPDGAVWHAEAQVYTLEIG